MNLSNKQKLSDILVRPAVAGVVAGISSFWVFGTGMGERMNFLGIIGLPPCLGVGLAAAGGVFLGTVSKDFVLPYLPRNSKFAESEGLVLIPVLSGLATTGILYPSLDGSTMALAKSFGLGAGSAVASDYLSRTFLLELIR
jgi:hypothetical protein